MANNRYAGMGTSLSSSYYLRNMYVSNRNAGKSSTRSSLKNSELSLADGKALRRAIKNLGSFTYDSDSDKNIRSSVEAFLSTYNNTISSLSESNDYDLTRNLKQLRSLSAEYADALDDVGITANSNGTLTSRSTLFPTSDLSKLEELFSSDSDFMQRANSYAKRIERRSESLEFTERNEYQKQLQQEKKSSAPDTAEASANPFATAVNSEPAPNSVIGQNINIVL